MQLLTPAWLLAAVAVLIPIVYHLRRDTPPEVIRVGSVADLATGAAMANRRVPKDLLLLATRCALLLLVALAMAQPFIGAAVEGRRVVVAPAGEWPVVDSLTASGAVFLTPSRSAYPWASAAAAARQSSPGDTLLIVSPDDASRWLGPRPRLDRASVAIAAPGKDPRQPGPALHQRAAAEAAATDATPKRDASAIVWWLILALAPLERALARRSTDAG